MEEFISYDISYHIENERRGTKHKQFSKEIWQGTDRRLTVIASSPVQEPRRQLEHRRCATRIC